MNLDDLGGYGADELKDALGSVLEALLVKQYEHGERDAEYIPCRACTETGARIMSRVRYNSTDMGELGTFIRVQYVQNIIDDLLGSSN